MKTIILIIAVVLFSCSEEEVKPPCEDFRIAFVKAQADYNAILETKLVMPTLAQAHAWGVAAEAAQEDYRKAKVLYEECGK